MSWGLEHHERGDYTGDNRQTTDPKGVCPMILERIIARKFQDLAVQKREMPLRKLEALIPELEPPRKFEMALRLPGEIAIIAETKKASPSKGIIRQEYNPEDLARAYELDGAAAVSVLTEERFFLGHPEHLSRVKKVTKLPVLRKDFIIDPYQIFESRALGADAILLIAAALTPGQLIEFQSLAAGLGLACLVEVHTEAELTAVLMTDAQIIGINNRDLRTFQTDLNTTFKLLKLINDAGITIVSESGIKSVQDIERLLEHGVQAALVGEALVSSADPGASLIKLLGRSL
ncbi:MAG: Indole-3-glycerol phosphate synthase [Pelotomaculum sp. PtaB.Bin104]|nr:MAG: Indole-3-glycerol phosphate synthase [Pelotomaculum sp. PtaB.Bin104]